MRVHTHRHTGLYSEERIACALKDWFGARVHISASVSVFLLVRPGCCLSANSTLGSPRSAAVCCSIARRPAGGAAPRAAPAGRPTPPGRPESSWEVGCGFSSDSEQQPWQTQMMTHRPDERLCQRHAASGVTAHGKRSASACLARVHICSPSILGHLQAE